MRISVQTEVSFPAAAGCGWLAAGVSGQATRTDGDAGSICSGTSWETRSRRPYKGHAGTGEAIRKDSKVPALDFGAAHVSH